MCSVQMSLPSQGPLCYPFLGELLDMVASGENSKGRR